MSEWGTALQASVYVCPTRRALVSTCVGDLIPHRESGYVAEHCGLMLEKRTLSADWSRAEQGTASRVHRPRP